MSLQRCKREHTYREYLVWMAWLSLQWNEPDRSDHYLMQIAQTVRQILRKNPNKVTLQQQKIPFVSKEDGRQSVTKEVTAKQSKTRWFGWIGLGRK